MNGKPQAQSGADPVTRGRREGNVAIGGTYCLAIDLGTYNSAATILRPDGDIEAVSEKHEEGRAWHPGESIKPFPSVVV
ncbi:MAG: hypothetical protein HY815_33635 [Candidatus Riflebacteria bacterium]|nr:hypothetical protein [Candidatus Riflebacteria bacterium]